MQRWTNCLACGSHFDNVLYRCLQCSDFAQGAPGTSSAKGGRADYNSGRSFGANHGHGSTASPHTPLRDYYESSSAEGMGEERASYDSFHVCPDCVRKSSLFHPVRHVFVRVDIPWLVKKTNTTSAILLADETASDLFDAPEAKYLSPASCTLGKLRSHTTTSEDASIWESFIHTHIISVPGIRSLKTISTKYHKQSCDRCKARICGIRWERLCSTATVSIQRPSSTNLVKSPSDGLPSNSPTSGPPLSPSASSMRAYTLGDPKILEASSKDSIHSHGSFSSTGSLASVGQTFSNIAASFASFTSSGSHSTNSTASSLGSAKKRKSGHAIRNSEKDAATAFATPGQPQTVQKSISLCMHCFDTLHSDFASAPLGNKRIENPEHEDSFYRGYLWAHVRCLFDSATQPLLQSLEDVAEIERADSVFKADHHHHNHHHHSPHPPLSSLQSHSTPSIQAPNGSTNSSESQIQSPSPWERRHIGSDQSAQSSSSGSAHYPLSDTSAVSRADGRRLKASTVRLDDSVDAMDEWVLLDPTEVNPYEAFMSDEERDDESCSAGSHSSEDEAEEQYAEAGIGSAETLFDAGKRQALTFLQADDVMRPAEVTEAIEPFVRAIDEPKKAVKGLASQAFDEEPNTSTLAGDGFVLEEPDPVFELTPDLQSELATHKARSIFEYGLDRLMPGEVSFKGLPPLSEVMVDPVIITDVSPRASFNDPYGPSTGYGPATKISPKASVASLPPGYTNVESVIPSITPYLPSIASEGSSSDSILPPVIDLATTATSIPPNGVSGVMPYAEVTASPYALPAQDGRIGPAVSSPTQGSDKRLAESSPAPLVGLEPNPPYYSSGSIKPEDDTNDSTQKPAIPLYVPAENERDWNGEWQTLLKDFLLQKTDCLLHMVTIPVANEDETLFDKERSLTSLLQDAGMSGMSSLSSLYGSITSIIREAVEPADGASAVPLRQSIHIAPSQTKATDPSDSSDPAKDMAESGLELSKRIALVREELAGLKHLKGDKAKESVLMMSVIRLKQFLQEFTETASRIAKTIVSEVSLPMERKTIQPRRLGGIAGGEKFLEEGIFFKFAIDAYKIYGGDKFAMKAAGHEIQGLRAYMSTETQGLSVPLSTIIDYAGYRVVASARLPISQDTLIYGSSDGGKTIHRVDPVFNKMMEDAAVQLNIKQHEVAPGISLHSAVDMEGHKGTDGRYYVLDTARVFPPEPPLRTFVAVIIPPDSTSPHKWASSPPICEIELVANRTRWREQVRAYLAQTNRLMVPTFYNLQDGQVHYLQDTARSLPLNSRASALISRVVRGPAIYVIEPGQRSTQLFNLLRSNYVARQPHSLSSDAFTSFGRIDQDIHNTEVEDAFYRLLGIDIPNFVKYLTAKESHNLTHSHLMDKIKQYGINFRLLGFLRSHIPNEPDNKFLRSTLLVEMVTRVAKNDLRASLRSARRIRKSDEFCLTPQMSDRQAHEIVLSAFNLLLGNSTSSNFMWQSFMKTHIIVKYGQYGQALTESELDASYDLRQEINKLQLFQTLQIQLGVRFKDSVLVKFQRRPECFEASAPFCPDDLEGLYPKSKMGMETKLTSFFSNMVKRLPTVILRMEAMRGFYGESSREMGFTGLLMAHVLNRFDHMRSKVPEIIKLVFEVFSDSPGLTPAEVTCKSFYLLASSNISAGKMELAEAQLKASYYCYRRALANHVAARPSELGCTFLLLILDRLCFLMYKQNRRFESWYYAQKFVRIWQSMPYPGDIKDLEHLTGRPTPLAFALLWERDFYFTGGQRCFIQNGQIIDLDGNLYTNLDDFVVDRKTGMVVRKTNLVDENVQGMPEMTPQVRLTLESMWFKTPTPAEQRKALLWRNGFKTPDAEPFSSFTMATEVWSDWIESGAWKRERLFDGRALRTAVWTPSVSMMYNRNIVRPEEVRPATGTKLGADPSVDDLVLLPSDPHSGSTIVPARSLDHSGGNNKIISTSTASIASSGSITHLPKSPSLNNGHSPNGLSGQPSTPHGNTTSPPTARSSDSLHSSNSSVSTSSALSLNAAGVATQPSSISLNLNGLPSATTGSSATSANMPPNVISPMAGTIEAPHILKSGHVDTFTFRWHLAFEWSHEITGSESFVLVRYEPTVWVVPSFVNRDLKSNPHEVSTEGKRILTGAEVGQFVEGEHQVIASMPARLMRAYGLEKWTNLNLDYGFYQVHLVSATGRLWGKTTSRPTFVLSNMTIVLNKVVKHHVLRWNEQSHWMSSAMQAQGLAMTHMTYIPLGSGYHTSYWTDSNDQLWYGLAEPNAYAPPYMQKALPTEEILRLQTHPIVVPAPTDFAYTFQRFASILGPDISLFTGSGASGAIPVSASVSTSPVATNTPISSATMSTSTTGTSGQGTMSSISPPLHAVISPLDALMERAPSNTSLSSSMSTSTKSSSKHSHGHHRSASQQPSSASASQTSVKLTEKFWKETGDCNECDSSDMMIIHYDAQGHRVPPGSQAANSVLLKRQVESQLSRNVMWTKMRKVPAFAQEKVVKVVASNSHVMALLANGDVFTWGNNLYGELGHGDLVRMEEPRVVKRLRGKQVRDISCGVGRSVALIAGNRSVYQWGMDFSMFPEPHPFWKSLPDEEVTKVVFQSQNGFATPSSFDPESMPQMPGLPRDVNSYGLFEAIHNTTANTLWHSNLMIYLTDTGRAYVFGHDPHHIMFKHQTPILLDIFEGHPVLDAQIGANFMAFIGEDGSVWTAGYNEIGQRGTGVVGDPSMRLMERRTIRSCNPHKDGRPVFQQAPPPSRSNISGVSPRQAHHSKTKSKGDKKEIHHHPENTSTNTHVAAPAPANTSSKSKPSSLAVSASIAHPLTPSGLTGILKSQVSSVVDVQTYQREALAAKLGHHGRQYTTTPGFSQSFDKNDLEEARETHPMNFATLPANASKVSFSEPTKIVRISARGKKIFALSSEGLVWHWGNGIFMPAKHESTSGFVVVDVVANPDGAILHTGSVVPPVQVLSERGRTRRKALGLETPTNFEVFARQMLLMPNGLLKHHVEGTPVPAKSRLVVVIDWARPSVNLLDRGEELRFVVPGSDSTANQPRALSEIKITLPSGPQRKGQVIVDYLNPEIKRWSIDQGIASGFLNKFLEPLLEWAPLSEDSREALLRRRDRTTALVRSRLVERQQRLQQEARAMAEAKMQEARNASLPSTASSSYSTLPAYIPAAAAATTAAIPPTNAISVPAPLLSKPSKSSLFRTSSTTSLGSLGATLPIGVGARSDTSNGSRDIDRNRELLASSSIVGPSGTPPQPKSSFWDGSAGFIDTESSSNHGSVDESIETNNSLAIVNDVLTDQQEEYAPMVPPGEYEVVFVASKPSLHILARSAPVRFSYEGVKASIELETTTVSADKPLIAHWKCEMKLDGLNIVARDADTGKCVKRESLRQRTSDSVRWKLNVGSNYRILIERSDDMGNVAVLAESSVVECVNVANPALSAFGNSSVLSALSAMPTEVETCSEWSTFFKQCNLPANAVPKYSALFHTAGIETSFIPSLDSAILEKIGITSLQHHISILSNVTRVREQHMRAIMAQELQRMLADASGLSQFETSSNSSFLH